MRAAIYARISKDRFKDGPEEGMGVERQEALCRARCEERGWSVTRVYVDNDVSAAGKAKARPEYDQMLSDAAEGHFDVLVAYSNSRLTRRPAEWLALINLAQSGMQIHTLQSGQHDLTTADGRAVAMTVAVWDAAEAERTGERVKAQKAQRAAKGQPQGGRYRVYGYSRDWTVIEAEKAVVVEAFERRTAGESLTSIARDFNARSITTAQGKAWDTGNLSKMLAKPGYAGLREYDGAVIGSTSYPALVSTGLFYGAQNQKQARSKGKNARRHLLSGFLVCSKCLSTMKGKESAGKRTYVCSASPGHGGCGKTGINMGWVNSAVLGEAFTKQQQTDPVDPDVRTSVEDIEAQIAEIDERIEELKAAYTARLMRLPEMLDLKASEESTKAALVKQSAEAVVTHWGIMQPFEDFEAMNLSQKRAFISTYVANVVVGPATVRGRRVTENTTRQRLTVHFADGEVKTLGPLTVVDRFQA